MAGPCTRAGHLRAHLRDRDLSAARIASLADQNAQYRTIAAIGHSWGFVDATHFSKVFKQAYGLSPRSWRDLNRPPSPPPEGR
ncbi:AraC family transcriptional regulator [Streptomyces sp. NPDC060031]|uniref:AraC family transcriptional regulator n=1 Tax=Streptomyces sp. NPDC060031 TaxID=3347043 RepID=UPI003699EC8D